MREPPNIPNSHIIDVVQRHYAIVADYLSFLALGLDATAGVYRLHTTTNIDYFVKVRQGSLNEAGLSLPRYLYEQGVPHIIAPIPTTTGDLWADADDFAVVLYPFVEGQSGYNAGLNDDQWRAFGATLKHIHSIHLPPDLSQSLRSESYSSPTYKVIRDIQERVAAGSFSGEVENAMAAEWRVRADEIAAVVARAETLADEISRAGLPFVLCHADVHTGNILVGNDSRIWIVDWDEVRRAPKERDLMFVIGGLGADWTNAQAETMFFEGYGLPDINPRALAYYRYAWAVEDIGSFGAAVFLRPDLSEADKRAAIAYFVALFAPGNIVALARAADRK